MEMSTYFVDKIVEGFSIALSWDIWINIFGAFATVGTDGKRFMLLI